VTQTKNRGFPSRRLHIFAFIIGLWMVLSPFVLHYDHGVATANGIFAGLLVSFFAFTRLRSPSDGWASWILAGMGLWLVFSPFIFGYTRTSTYWNELLFGIALIIAMFSAMGSNIRHHSHLAH
jgi:hypothetical protein